jgi:hypothetical protein
MSEEVHTRAKLLMRRRSECPLLAHCWRDDIPRSAPLLKVNLPRRLHGRMVSE